MTKRTQDHPSKADARAKREQDRVLSEELETSFPASDPPSSTQPGGGVTGAEVAKPKAR